MTYPDEYNHRSEPAPAPITPEDEEHSYSNLVTEPPHLCTADCFTYEERRDDPTIDDHFAARGAHECEAAH